MSRIQTRISDYRRTEVDQNGRRIGRPVVVKSRVEPQVTIFLTGQRDSGSGNQTRAKSDRNLVEGVAERLVLTPNQILQCEYHLMDFDGFETRMQRLPMLPTFRRKRRGAVVSNSGRLVNGSESALVKRREAAPTPLVRTSITAIENSVVWQTAGKGDTDFGVHFFERRDAKKHQPLDLYRPYVFRTICPSSPLTYRGKLLSISWMVRVRVFMSSGDGLTFERKFALVN